MHILHLIKTSNGAGWALQLMKELKSRFPEITFSVVIPVNGRHSEEYHKICEKVYDFDYKLDFSTLVRGKRLTEIVEKENPEIIHSWFTQTTLYARIFLRKVNIPRLFQVVGPLHLESLIFKWADILSADKNDYWIATSKYILEKYRKSGVADKKLFLNYAFVDVKKLHSEKDLVKPIDLKKKYNIPGHYKLIGTASYIYPPKFYEKTGVKGHEYLLRSFEKILTIRQDVALIISGGVFGNDKNYLTKLKKQAEKIAPKRIYFTGEYEHVYEVISNFDVFVYLSKSENLGGVFESLLFEVPTVSSNRGALPELVIDNLTGYTVNIKKPEEIADKVLTLLDNPDNKMTLKGKEMVLEVFEKSKIIEKGFQIYSKLTVKS